MTDKEREDFLKIHQPYRMTHLDGLIWACKAISRYGREADLAITVGTHEKIMGPVMMITNPLLEAGLIKCRVVANFLGIKREHGKANFGKNPGGDKHYICKILVKNDEFLPAVAESDLKSKYGAETNYLLDCISKTLGWASEASAHLLISGTRADCKIMVECAKALLWLVEEKVYKALNWPLKHYKLWTEPPI